jgi:hypothetical protein
MAAAINVKRRRPEFLCLPSPPFLCSYLNSHSSACTPLCLCSTPTHALEPQFHRRRRLGFPPPPWIRRRWWRIGSAAPSSWFLWSPGAYQARAAAGSRPRRPKEPRPARRSAARSAAVAKFPHRRFPFVFELASLFCTRWAKTPARYPIVLSILAPPRARRSSSAAPFRRRPPARHDCPPRLPCHVRKRPRFVLHWLVDGMVSRMPPKHNAGELPPRAAALRRARRCAPLAHVPRHWIRHGQSWSKQGRYPLAAVHRGPVSRAHDAVHNTRARRRPLDPISIARRWQSC